MAHKCPSNQYCFRYEKDEDPNRNVVPFQDGLQLTKCPEFLDVEFNGLDEMFLMEESLQAINGAKESGYARRYGKPKDIQKELR